VAKTISIDVSYTVNLKNMKKAYLFSIALLSSTAIFAQNPTTADQLQHRGTIIDPRQAGTAVLTAPRPYQVRDYTKPVVLNVLNSGTAQSPAFILLRYGGNGNYEAEMFGNFRRTPGSITSDYTFALPSVTVPGLPQTMPTIPSLINPILPVVTPIIIPVLPIITPLLPGNKNPGTPIIPHITVPILPIRIGG
jgi:hypothetical protein